MTSPLPPNAIAAPSLVDELAQAHAEGAAPRGAEPEQLALSADLEPVRRAPGRPAGSRHRRSLELAEYLGSRGVLPGEALADLVRNGWEQLHRDLGGEKAAAFDRWFRVVEALMPYVHPRLAQLEVKGDQDAAGSGDPGLLHLAAVSAAAAAAGAAAAGHLMGAADPRSVTTSQVIDIPGETSDVPTSVP
jgi:hypothetical protein